MTKYKDIGDDSYNSETGNGEDNVSYTPEEAKADSPEERSEAQRLADGDIEVDNDGDGVFVDPNSSYTEPPEDEEKEDEETEEVEEEETGEEDKTPEKKKKTGKPKVDPEVEKLAKRFSQKRINKISREKFELRDENEKLKKELKSLKTRADESDLEKRKVEHTSKKPKYEDFEEESDYHEALGRWAARAEMYDLESATPVEEEPSTEDQSQQAFENARDRILNEGEDKYDDFAEIVLKTDGSITITKDMVLAAGDSDSAADIFYYLGQNPEESHRIAKLNGSQIAREMGKIESLVLEEVTEHLPHEDSEFLEQSKKKTPKKMKKKASPPPPVKPLSGGGKQAVDLESAGIAEYFEARGYDRTGMKKRKS